ncbi:DNA-binding response regulator, NarL/FixJ family, contains REC and HTH domains [Marivirga sericea]|uniref:DNA-binding response regulator, NarL/FixJ family, contains REC and HTH domains n=1 Tax=Marivirga sericea TaxID=1028 RepID=A0A1X7I1P9_9BACT|nr:response regulator transcription factor [Marivirga sericea]SMG07919.1 DNA-binding response regulator, NarL/FixJ family, contains REC and HTH domains [Marivirga sericea]
MNKVINLAIVDDEALILEGIALLFSNVSHINVVQEAKSGLEFLDAIAEILDENFPDIALIDIQMKPMDGFDLVEALRANYPELKIIILSSHYKSNIIGHMIKLGVSAFIPKNSNKKELLQAIESVHEMGVYFTKTDQEMLMHFMRSKSKGPTLNPEQELSSREIDVLKLICQENTNQEIADQLFLSKRTVESHRQRILEKVGAKNTVGLVVYAIANDIHPLP